MDAEKNEETNVMILTNKNVSTDVQNDEHLRNLDTSKGVITEEAILIFQWINYALVGQAIDIFGVVSNIINIVCFVKQGFKDPVNVSLLGLAISDFGSLITLIWLNLTLTPAFQQADLTFDSVEVNYLTAGWPHVIFTRVTSWITALITLERCLCIIIPLKVKSLITPKRIMVIIVCLFTVLICSVSPLYCVYWLGMKFVPAKNKTLFGLLFTEDREIVEKVSFAINNVFIPFSALIVVLIATIILVFELKRKSEWRKMTNIASNSESLSNRDQKVAKMVVMISTLFIVCFIPVVINFVAMTVEPELAIDGKYRSMFLIVFGLSFTLESTNSSMNIFIYYHMSSKYRDVFRQLFFKRSAQRKSGLYK